MKFIRKAMLAALTSAGLLGAWQDGRDGTAEANFSEIYSCVLLEE